MFWFQHDLGRRRKEQTQEFFYHLLFNTIQLYQLFFWGSCYRFPTEIMTLTWPTQTLAFQTELLQDRMSASIKGSSGKNGFPKMLWKQKWWWANQGKIFGWSWVYVCIYKYNIDIVFTLCSPSPRHELIASCKNPCVLIQKITYTNICIQKVSNTVQVTMGVSKNRGTPKSAI